MLKSFNARPDTQHLLAVTILLRIIQEHLDCCLIEKYIFLVLQAKYTLKHPGNNSRGENFIIANGAYTVFGLQHQKNV
jgi:hypothetical protein